MVLARVTVEILGPAPVAELAVRARIERPGRSVELLEGELTVESEPVMTVRAWRVKASTAPAVHRDNPPPARPGEPSPPPPGLDDFGYGRAVELRFAAGGWWQRRPATVWTRLRGPLVAGEQPTGLQRLLAVADSGNGISGIYDMNEWWFINPELTLHVEREPEGEWICLDAVTLPEPTGLGMADTRLFDERGAIGRAVQTLLVAQR
jgi:hypothetical protein